MTWRKSHCEKNLNPEGTKRKLTPAQRSVWDDLTDMAAISPVKGEVVVAEGISYTITQLAQRLKTGPKIIKDSIAAFRRLGMMEGWKLTNWEEHQSEYLRLKKYRKKGTDEGTAQGTPLESERDIEGEKDLSEKAGLDVYNFIAAHPPLDRIKQPKQFAKQIAASYKRDVILKALKSVVDYMTKHTQMADNIRNWNAYVTQAVKIGNGNPAAQRKLAEMMAGIGKR